MAAALLGILYLLKCHTQKSQWQPFENVDEQSEVWPGALVLFSYAHAPGL